MSDMLTIGGKNFTSRLMTGTGKHRNTEDLLAALEEGLFCLNALFRCYLLCHHILSLLAAWLLALLAGLFAVFQDACDPGAKALLVLGSFCFQVLGQGWP